MKKEGPMRSALLARSVSRVLFIASCISIGIILPSLVCAQAYFGTVSGELSDPTGALVQGASVVLTDQQKGFSFTATSDNNGRYLFRSIPPGSYVVTADVKGFEKVRSEAFKVD